MATATPAPDDHVLKNLHDLATDAAAAAATFRRKQLAGAFTDPLALVGEVFDVLSLFADLSLYTATAHNEHYEWSEGVDEKLEELEDQLSPESALLPEDALRLKNTLLSLLAAVPTSAEGSALLKQSADEAVAFIDSITIEDADDGGEAPGAGDNDDEETETEN